MNRKRHIPRWAFWLIVGTVIFIIVMAFTLIGTGSLENAKAATRSHPVPPPPPVLNLSPSPTTTDPSSSDDGSDVESSGGDVEDDDTPPPPDLVSAAPPLPPGTGAPTTPDQTTNPTSTVPQVVTTPTQPGTGDVTTPPPAPPPYDACRNIDGIQPSVPLGKVRNDEGDCLDPPENNVGLCQGDQFILTPVSKVADGLQAGQKPGPWVAGIGLVCWISDLVTYHANPADFFFSGFYVGDGGSPDGLFKCQAPYDGWLLYPYYTKKNQVFGQVFTSQKCP